MLRGRGSRLRGRRLPAAALVLVCALALPAAASAKVWVVKGRGFGHGAGMSQYGAKGYAEHGFGSPATLPHYSTGPPIGTPIATTVRVLLRSGARSISFRGASAACGTAVKPGKTYVAKRKGATRVVLRT